MGELSQSDERAIAALVAALKDYDEDVRAQVAGALVKLGQSDDRVIGSLLAALKDQDDHVRAQAAGALVKLGQSDDRVVGALLATLKGQSGFVRAYAAGALGEVKSSDDRVVGALLAALKDHDEDIRAQAAGALGKLGHSDDRVVGALLVALKDQNRFVRADAAGALGEIKSSDDRVVGALLAALKDQSGFVHAYAAGALVKLGQSDERVIAALVAALKEQDDHVRAQVASALGKLERVKALPELLLSLKHPLSGYRTAAAQALAQKDIPIDSTLQVIAKLREDERPWVCLGAWEAYELLESRREAEKKSAELLHEADSLFANGEERGAKGEWQRASDKYESAFESNPKVTRTDSLNAARAKFQQARCAALLKRKGVALEHLQIAFEYHPTLRDTLQAEMSKPENDWKVLEGNWYLREVLLKKE